MSKKNTEFSLSNSLVGRFLDRLRMDNACPSIVEEHPNKEKEQSEWEETCPKSSPNRVENAGWTLKSARNLENNRYVRAKVVVTVLACALCMGATLENAPDRIQLCAYLGTLALILYMDTGEIFSRVLANQSRCILASLLILIVIAIETQHKRFSLVVGIAGLLMLLLVVLMNSRWLASYNWNMSEAVQTALLKDVDNMAIETWRADGCREVYTILAELGFSNASRNIEIFCKPIWIAGYLNGNERIVKYKQKLERAENQAAKLADYKQYIEEMEDLIDQHETEEAQTKAQITGFINEIARLQAELKEARKFESDAAQLREANEELLAELLSLPDADQEARREALIDAVENGMSIRKAGEMYGFKKSTAFNIIKKHRESLSDQEDETVEV